MFSNYAKDSGTYTLERVRYWKGRSDHACDKEEVHTPEEKIAPPAVPSDELLMRVNPDEDDDLPLADRLSWD
jgi:hypothetical protein